MYTVYFPTTIHSFVIICIYRTHITRMNWLLDDSDNGHQQFDLIDSIRRTQSIMKETYYMRRTQEKKDIVQWQWWCTCRNPTTYYNSKPNMNSVVSWPFHTEVDKLQNYPGLTTNAHIRYLPYP